MEYSAKMGQCHKLAFENIKDPGKNFLWSNTCSKSAITTQEKCLEGVLQNSISNLKCSYSKKHEVITNKIFTVVKIFHCLHLEVFID